MILATLLTTAVYCTTAIEIDDSYFATCKGPRDRMESYLRDRIEKDKLGGFCVPYAYATHDDVVDFVIVCD